MSEMPAAAPRTVVVAQYLAVVSQVAQGRAVSGRNAPVRYFAFTGAAAEMSLEAIGLWERGVIRRACLQRELLAERDSPLDAAVGWSADDDRATGKRPASAEFYQNKPLAITLEQA
jgi:hypothetical protein